MKNIINILVFFLLLFNTLKADILSIHKKIIPISLLQINSITHKKNKNINFLIISSKNQMAQAIEFKKDLPNKIKIFNLHKTIINANDTKQYLSKHNNFIDGIYLFDIDKKYLHDIIKFANTHHIVTYSYSKKALKLGALLYIDYTNKIHFLINRSSMKKANIHFNSQFLQLVEFY